MSGITFVMWLTFSFGSLDDQLGIPTNEDSIGNKKSGRVEDAHSALTKQDRNSDKRNRLRSLKNNGSWRDYPTRTIPFLALSALFFMVYVGIEMSFSNYLPSILITRTGMSESNATATLSLFWGAVVFGRLFAGLLAERLGYARYLLITTIGAVFVFGLMVVTMDQIWMLVLIVLSGLCFSGIFGISLVYANGLLPGMTERTTSLLVAFGGLGGALFPKITGWMLDRYPIQSTMWYIGILTFSMLVILTIMLLLGRAQYRSSALSK